MSRGQGSRLRRAAGLLGCATLATFVATFTGFANWTSHAPQHILHARHSPQSRRVALQADKERTDEERLQFMESPLGQLIGGAAKLLSSGPLNEGKIWFAKMQAGEYDEAAVAAKLESYISSNPAVMFSFSK
eukprot:TRINITY_DN36746_c0_g1_i1.p2 TRINITY_DN36746_c0_g1~~TRINITY_DN36746_c0_g1_i1.p2  ORF type:complete len:132 (-),score=27.06 TRINITY_DN36746_c0_g1_i1:294-689(-)